MMYMYNNILSKTSDQNSKPVDQKEYRMAIESSRDSIDARRQQSRYPFII